MLPSLLSITAACATFCATAPGQVPGVSAAARELAIAVDLPTPELRRDAARRLAKLDEIDLEAWLEAARCFAPEAYDWKLGPQSLRVDLTVLGKVESTELWVVIPKAFDPAAPSPVLLALHGAGGDGRSIAGHWQPVANRLGAIVLAPTEAGPNLGFTGEPRERHSVLEALRWLRRHANVDENRIWLTGYSRGGILCWDLALRFPGTFAAVAPQAGGPRLELARGRNNMRYLDNLTGTPVRAMVGSLESADLRWSVSMFTERALARGIEPFELVTVEGAGHSFDPVTGRSWPEWFEEHVRAPWPMTVVRRAARRDETTNSWLSIDAFGKGVEETFQPTIRRRKGEPELDQAAMRRKVIDLVEEKTARAHAAYVEKGRIDLETSGVRELRLLLPRERLPEAGRFVVRQGKKDRKLGVKESSAVLLGVFVERFDRSFLPVVELRVPCRDR